MSIFKISYLLAIQLSLIFNCFSQSNQPYTASFIGRMGTDTVLVETYTMLNNHLYGKAFIRVPEDYIGEFSVHFYPDGTIREFNVAAMDALNSSLPFKSVSNAFEYRISMNCSKDTCTFYNSRNTEAGELIFKHQAYKMDFVGGWVPFISLMEWVSMRLKRSGLDSLSINMVNHYIGVYPIGVRKKGEDTTIFGGPFIEYTKMHTDAEGRIKNSDGYGTPWNYIVTKHDPIDIDAIAKRLIKTKGIGIPSPNEKINAVVKNSSIEIQYGRPYKRGRKIFGSVVPYDSVWRTGANGPTILRLEKGIKINNTIIPKGIYSIYTIPKESEWTLIFNTDINRWPTDPYRIKDFAQVIMKSGKKNSVTEQFTIGIQETKKGGVLNFQWDDTIASVEFEVLNY